MGGNTTLYVHWLEFRYYLRFYKESALQKTLAQTVFLLPKVSSVVQGFPDSFVEHVMLKCNGTS